MSISHIGWHHAVLIQPADRRTGTLTDLRRVSTAAPSARAETDEKRDFSQETISRLFEEYKFATMETKLHAVDSLATAIYDYSQGLHEKLHGLNTKYEAAVKVRDEEVKLYDPTLVSTYGRVTCT